MGSENDTEKLGFNAAWSMAVGGMIGGGIFSTLGVVIAIAGPWAWLSFVVAGAIAFVSGYSYVKLAGHYGEGGGAFTFLREIDAEGFAGSLSWILIVGYVLTNAVYAFTFGQYLGNVFGAGAWLPRVSAVAILAVFVFINLRGVGEAGGTEVFLVWFKLFVLLGLAGFGLWKWNPDMLSRGVPDSGIVSALFGASSVFMAYEGFQLLTYDYEDMRDPQRTLPRAILTAIAVVILVYVAVTLGVTMIIGADQIVANQEVALAVAGQAAMGTLGLILVTIGAAFSTSSAINSTLFATARLTHEVTRSGELPAVLDHSNSAGIPDRAVIFLGGFAALLAVIGSLSNLVEAASLAFLFTFATVNALAFRQHAGHRAVTLVGAIGAAAALLALIYRMVTSQPIALAFLGVLAIIAIFVRPVILRHVSTE
jgi:amino acid transporter